jgi:predicted PurR-regulated permease PerM
MRRLEYLSPLRTEYEQMLTSRFLLISRASIRGTLLVGLVQGTIGALTLLIFGVHTWLLWGFVMVLLSIIPMVGAWLVLMPAGIVQIVLGNTWQGIGIILVNVVVVSNLDNILRPRLVGRDAKLHDLVILFSTLGGIAVFGVMGFIVGPVLAALFVTVLDMYGMEYADDLKASITSHQPPPPNSPASGIEPQPSGETERAPKPAPPTDEQPGEGRESTDQEPS